MRDKHMRGLKKNTPHNEKKRTERMLGKRGKEVMESGAIKL